LCWVLNVDRGRCGPPQDPDPKQAFHGPSEFDPTNRK
jgi:hypothetical protein